MIETSPIYKVPDIPSKWDIIPIHSSDRASFKRCRRYWDYNSPARQNLVLRADIHGVNIPLWFGTGIHWALEQYYTPGLSRDPVEAWKTWFDIQWRGGVVTEEWLPRVYDLKPQPIINADVEGTQGKLGTPHSVTQYMVRGLEDIIPDPDQDVFDEHYTLGIQMMQFYKEYAELHDDFVVLVAEHDFSVPVWDYEKDKIFTAVDAREDSPNYGKVLEVHARGRMDLIKLREHAQRLGIMDHKTAAAIGEDYFAKLESDEQCTNYLACAQVEANYYDLPYKGKSFEEITYNVLRKAYPKPPTELSSGVFSINRTTESTTYGLLMAWINTHMPGIPLSEKQQAYVDYVRESGDSQFIIREPVRRNQAQLGHAMQRLFLEAQDMLQSPRIYPNITNDFKCLGCQFRGPCLAIEDGSDVEQIIKDNYTSNKDR